MPNKLKIAHKQANGTLSDQADGTAGFGGTGGQSRTITSTGAKTLDVQYNTTGNTAVAHGYIIAQKGKRKFLVANATTNATGISGTQVTVIQLVNKAAGALSTGEGTITAYNTSNTAFNVSRISNRFVHDWSGNKYIYKINTVATATNANVASA
jgi:hypothetical protein